VVARTKIGPGTFVTGTSIDYPLLVQREQPRENAVYRVRALMRYHGGIARFDSRVRFGHKAAQAQQDFGGRPLTDAQGTAPQWLLLAGGLGALIGLVGLFLLARRKRTPGPRVARRALARAVEEARRAQTPLALVRIADSSGETAARRLASAIRGRVRRSNSLYRFGGSELLLVAPNTLVDAARLMCSDLQLPLSKAAGPGRIDIRVVEAGRRSAEDLLKRLEEPAEAPLDELELSPGAFEVKTPR
jgi:LPXTG-motif cell wall-anchored protein